MTRKAIVERRIVSAWRRHMKRTGRKMEMILAAIVPRDPWSLRRRISKIDCARDAALDLHLATAESLSFAPSADSLG